MKNIIRKTAVLMIMLIALQSIFITQAFAEKSSFTVAKNATEARSAVVPIYLVYPDENNVVWRLQRGTAFFIDANYVISCNHVTSLSYSDKMDIVEDSYYDFDKDIFLKNCDSKMYCEIGLGRDVKVTAKVTEAKSADYDFAVLKLNTSLTGITVLSLAKSAEESMKDMTPISCLGFPEAANTTDEGDYFTSADVSITAGNLGKFETISGTQYFLHGAKIDNGSSGGPVILEDASVVGIAAGVTTSSSSSASFEYALSIDSIVNILDKFGVPYTPAGGSAQSSSDDENDCEHDWGTAPTSTNGCEDTFTCTKCGETKVENNGNHDFGDWKVVSEATTDAAGEKERKCSICGETETETIPQLEKKTAPTLYIIIGAAALVVVIIVVIAVIMISSGKKKQPVAGPSMAGQRPVAPPPQAPQPVAPQRPAPYSPPPAPHIDEGAGNTTVLNEGSNETTVLGPSAAAVGSLIRKKNGERIVISGNEFIIGKERRRVNYCIADNNAISRSHAKFINRAGTCYVVDMGSTNFTFVNGEKLVSGQEKKLNYGDKIKLAEEEFEYKA